MYANGQQISDRVLIIFHANQLLERFREFIYFALYYALIALTLLPTISFHKPWLTESSGACQQSQTMEECPFNYFTVVQPALVQYKIDKQM